MQYALIKNNVIENVAEGDAEWAQAVSSDWQYVVDLTGMSPHPGVGWEFNGTDFVAPVVTVDDRPPELQQRERITRFAFRARFTSAEKVAIEIACLDNPLGTQEQRAQAAMLRSMQKDVDAASYIDLENLDTRNGVQALEDAGLLAAGRASQILNSPTTLSERWGH